MTKIWVCDDDGEELAMGEDVAVLKLQLADRMRARFEAAANADVERTRHQHVGWRKTAGAGGNPGRPGVSGAGGRRAKRRRAGVRQRRRGRANPSAPAARACYGSPTPAQVAHLRKKFPLGMMAKVELPRLGTGGTALDDLILLAAEGAAGGVFPRSPDEFRAPQRAGAGTLVRSRGGDRQEPRRSRWRMLPEIRAWIAANRNDRNLGEIAEDLEEQLAWLFRHRFAWRAGFAGLRDYPRRLRAIRSRLGRLGSLPIVKDLEKMERLRRLWLPWFQRWTANPDDPALWPHGWALEELRVSLFAPDVPCVGKVSEKRIEEMLAASMTEHIHARGSVRLPRDDIVGLAGVMTKTRARCAK